MSLYLARHGQTDDNLVPRRFQGHLDTPLNATGISQSEALAQQVAPLGLQAIYTSPLDRARRTAAIVAAKLRLEPSVDERLAEGFRGRWEGRLMEEVERTEPKAYSVWITARSDFRFPDGESLAEHRQRALAALARISATGERALVVAHGGTIRFALLFAQGLEIDHFHEPTVENCELIELEADVIARLAALANEQPR